MYGGYIISCYSSDLDSTRPIIIFGVFRTTVSKMLGRVGIEFFYIVLSPKIPVKTAKNQ